MQVRELRAEEGARLLEGLDAALHEKLGQHPVDADFGSKPRYLFGIGLLHDYPFALSGHIRSKLRFFLQEWNYLIKKNAADGEIPN